MPYDPSAVDPDELQDRIDEVAASEEAALMEEEKQERAEKAARSEQFAGEQKAIDEADAATKQVTDRAAKADQLDPDRLNLNNNPAVQALNQATNARNIGYLRGLNGLFTAPERAFDWATGAMQEEKEQTGSYSPGWDPFREQIDQNKPQNWWEAGIQIGGQEATTIGATLGLGSATGLVKSVGGRLGLAGIEGFMSPDIGQENNVSGSVKWLAQNPDKSPKFVQDFYDKVEATAPWAGDFLRKAAINNPLATTEGDDVNTMTLKSLLENLMMEGTGEMLDFLYGSRRADEFDIETQNAEQAETQFRVDSEGLPSNTIDVDAQDVTLDPAGGRRTLPEGDPNAPESAGTWRASKNSPTADPGQGKYNPRTEPDVQWARRRKQSDDPNDMGTVGNGFSAAEVERWANSAGIPVAKQDEIAKKLYDSAYYQQALGKKDWAAGNQQAFRRFQKILGKEVTDMTPDQFWDEMFKKLGRSPKDWNVDPVVSDMMLQDLFNQVRNKGMAAIELSNKFDIMDTDGPMQNIAERSALFWNEIAKGKKQLDPEFLKKSPKERAQEMDDFSVEDYGYISKETEDFFRYIKEQPNDEMAKYAAELFAKHNIMSMKEMGDYLKTRYKRGDNWRGDEGSKQLQKELNIMQMQSQLALPDTLIRAAKGTAEILGINSAGRFVGALLTADPIRARRAIAEWAAWKEVIPDIQQIFKKNVDAWWNKDFSKIGNRYIKQTDPGDNERFERFYEYEMANGNLGDKVYVNTLKMLRDLNAFQPASYVRPALASIDEIGGVIAANMRARNLAVGEMLEGKPFWATYSKKDFKEARQNFYRGRVDDQGNFDPESDMFLAAQIKDATLTKPLEGPLGFINDLTQKYPEFSVFFRYMTTRVNDLMFDYKMMPALGLAHKEFMDTLNAIRKNDFAGTTKYGIETMDDAITHRNMWMGRNAMGLMVLSHFMQKKQDNELSGNGTLDWKVNKMWESAGWKPRLLTYGNFDIDLTEISGLGMIIGFSSDIVDNQKFMGGKWAEQNLATLAFTIGTALTSKEAFEPINNLMKLGQEGNPERFIAGLASSIPGAKWFDKLGDTLRPYALEYGKNLEEQMRARFSGGELFREESDRLQPKIDVLYNEQLSPWDFMQQVVNDNSPLAVSIRKDRPATNMLLNSGYKLALIGEQHDGISFVKNKPIRDAYQKELAKQKLGPTFENLMKEPKFMESLKTYHADLAENNVKDQPLASYYHLQMIHKYATRAKDEAWQAISEREDVQQMIEEHNQKKLEQKQSLYQTSQQPSVLNMTNK